LDSDNQKLRARVLIRRALKDLEHAARLLDPENVAALQRLRSASRDVKRAEGDL
jgi:hypothetical protein